MMRGVGSLAGSRRARHRRHSKRADLRVDLDTAGEPSSRGRANQAQTADQLVVASPHAAAKSVYVR
jgi:hypothetical protein